MKNDDFISLLLFVEIIVENIVAFMNTTKNDNNIGYSNHDKSNNISYSIKKNCEKKVGHPIEH